MLDSKAPKPEDTDEEEEEVPDLVENLMRHQSMKLTKIFSGFGSWHGLDLTSAMCFQSFTDTENINCYYSVI